MIQSLQFEVRNGGIKAGHLVVLAGRAAGVRDADLGGALVALLQVHDPVRGAGDPDGVVDVVVVGELRRLAVPDGHDAHLPEGLVVVEVVRREAVQGERAVGVGDGSAAAGRPEQGLCRELGDLHHRDGGQIE